MRWRSGCMMAALLCGWACEAPQDMAPDAARPAAPTAEAMGAFVDAQGYEGVGWRSDSDGPRPEITVVSPHDRVQAFQNEILITTRSGPSELGETYGDDSMAVKIMYDGDEVVGRAMMWKVPGTAGFTYFCYGGSGRCGYIERAHTREAPVFGRGLEVVCGQCHGGTIFTWIDP